MGDAYWRVYLSDEAKGDLRRLRKPGYRKIHREAVRVAESLRADPFKGKQCNPPIEAARRIHFWNDRYRIAWLVSTKEREVTVLAVGLKPGFYGRVETMLRFLPGGAEDDNRDSDA